MRDLYSDDYESVAGDAHNRLIPENLRRMAGAAVFVGLVAAMGLWSWRLGTRDAAEVPIIRAMEGPTRVQPKDPGGLTAAHQGLEVNAVLAGDPAPVPRVAAAPEPPVLGAEDAPQAELVVAAPDFTAEDVPAEDGPVAELPAPDDTGEAGTAGTLAADNMAADSLTADPRVGESAPTPASTIEALVAAAAADASTPAAADARPRIRPADLPRPVRAAAKPATGTSAAAKPAAAPAATEVASVGTGTRMVQLGAYDSEAITRNAWSRLVARNGDLLGAKQLYVERTTANARVFYRLRVAGFSSADETRVMCEALRARGVDCIPVTVQ